MNKTIYDFMTTFTDMLKDYMITTYNESILLDPHTAITTNGERAALSIGIENEDVRIKPVIYPKTLYDHFRSGTPISEIVSKTGDMIHRSYQTVPDLPALTAEDAEKSIRLNLVNTALNQKLLKDTPHFEICDGVLSAIPRWYISKEASFIVSNALAVSMNLTPDEILMMGKKNIEQEYFTAVPMNQLLGALTPSSSDEGQMIVLTSQDKLHGARALLSDKALKNVHEMFGGDKDVCILPSSTHEVICIAITDGMNPKELKRMVHDINENVVAKEDRLGDFIAKYDGKHLSLVGDSFKVEEPKTDFTITKKIHTRIKF